MLPEPTLPASLAVLPGAPRPCFTARSFATFCGLAAGLAGQVRRRTVTGMLTALRRVLITARISAGSPAQPTPDQTRQVLAAWLAAAA